MNTMLSRVRQRRDQGDKGFTLIELLVVVVILGVLIAIAIPLYLNYRKGANDASAKSDLRNAINVLEQCNSDNTGYPSPAFTITATGVAGSCTGQTINLSSGTSFTFSPNAAIVGPPAIAAGASYTIVDTNSGGAGKYYCYNSSKGGSVASVATPSPNTLAGAVTAGC